MLDKVKELIGDVQAFNANTKDEVETFRIKFLGSKGLLKDLFAEFKNVDPASRKDFGQALNTLKKSMYPYGLQTTQTSFYLITKRHSRYQNIATLFMIQFIQRKTS